MFTERLGIGKTNMDLCRADTTDINSGTYSHSPKNPWALHSRGPDPQNPMCWFGPRILRVALLKDGAVLRGYRGWQPSALSVIGEQHSDTQTLDGTGMCPFRLTPEINQPMVGTYVLQCHSGSD